MEAATRLAQFVERGEAPAEDLLVLADLWAAAGRRPDAAQALVRRAEILLHQGRVPAGARGPPAGRQPRPDARRRAASARGPRQRRVAPAPPPPPRRPRRVARAHGRERGRRLPRARRPRLARRRGEPRARRDVGARRRRPRATRRSPRSSAWSTRPRRAPRSTAPSRARSPRCTRVCETAARGVRATITSAEEELREVSGPRSTTALERLRDLDARRAADPRARADRDPRGRPAGHADPRPGREGLRRGPFPRREGAAAAVGPALVRRSGPRVARARKNLDAVEGYVAGFNAARATFDEALEADRTDEAWRLGCRMLATFLDSDLTRELLLPVPVTTDAARRARPRRRRRRPHRGPDHRAVLALRRPRADGARAPGACPQTVASCPPTRRSARRRPPAGTRPCASRSRSSRARAGRRTRRSRPARSTSARRPGSRPRTASRSTRCARPTARGWRSVPSRPSRTASARSAARRPAGCGCSWACVRSSSPPRAARRGSSRRRAASSARRPSPRAPCSSPTTPGSSPASTRRRAPRAGGGPSTPRPPKRRWRRRSGSC